MRYFFPPMLLASLISVLSLSSCNDDEKIRDAIGPVVVITSPSSGGLVKGSVTIKATVVETDLKQVLVFVDGVSVGSSTSSAIDLTWNSKLVEDGNHTIKVVATDNSNNSSEATATVEVLNSILKITMPVDGLRDDQDMWYFISDKQGTVLSVKQVQNGQTISFETPSDYVKGGTVELHRFYANEASHIYSVQSFGYVTPRSFSHEPYATYTPPTTVGAYKANIANIPFTNIWPRILGDGLKGWSETRVEGNFTLNVQLSLPSTSLTLSISDNSSLNDVPRFVHIEDVTVGGDVALDYSQMQEMEVHNIDLGGDYSFATAEMLALPIAGDFASSYPLDTYWGDFTKPSINTIKVFTPGDIYSEYWTSLVAEDGEIIRAYWKMGAVPTSFKPLNATISSFSGSGRTLQISTTGSYDVLTVGANVGKQIDGINHNFYWAYAVGGKSDEEVTIPALPAQIIDKYPVLTQLETKIFNRIGMAEYTGIDDYEDYLDFEFSVGIPYYEKYREASTVGFVIDGFTIVGRKKLTQSTDMGMWMYLPKFPNQMQ
jgi:hypothetical protein